MCKTAPFQKWSNALLKQFFAVSSENTAFSKKKILTWKYLACNLWWKCYIQLWRKMIPFPKKWLRLPKIFFCYILGKCYFFEKIDRWTNIQNLISDKKVIFILVHRHPLTRDLSPKDSCLLFSQKIQLFLKKTVKNNKIFNNHLIFDWKKLY